MLSVTITMNIDIRKKFYI